MAGEGKRHRDLREYVSSILDANNESYFPKDDEGWRLSLFRNGKSNETRFSFVDILVFQNDKVKFIIEIKDKDLQPKEIIGIICSTKLCDCYIGKNSKRYNFDKSVLFIVVNSEIVDKKHSSKKGQFKLIRDNINTTGSKISKYIICTEKEFESKYNEIKRGKL